MDGLKTILPNLSANSRKNKFLPASLHFDRTSKVQGAQLYATSIRQVGKEDLTFILQWRLAF
jgi:hypothetical protein